MNDKDISNTKDTSSSSTARTYYVLQEKSCKGSYFSGTTLTYMLHSTRDDAKQFSSIQAIASFFQASGLNLSLHLSRYSVVRVRECALTPASLRTLTKPSDDAKVIGYVITPHIAGIFWRASLVSPADNRPSTSKLDEAALFETEAEAINGYARNYSTREWYGMPRIVPVYATPRTIATIEDILD